MEKDSGVFFHMVCPEDAVWAGLAVDVDLHPALTVALSTNESPPQGISPRARWPPGQLWPVCCLPAAAAPQPAREAYLTPPPGAQSRRGWDPRAR